MGAFMPRFHKLAVALVCALILFTPALAAARAGGTYGSGGMGYSSQGSLGSRTYSNNGGQAIGRSVTPQDRPGSPYYGNGGQYGFAQSHPFLTGLAGAFFGSWLGSLLFPHWGYGYGMGFGHVFGSLFSWIIIILVLSMVFRRFRRAHGPLSATPMGGLGFGGQPQGYAGGYGGYGGGAATRDIQVNASDYAAFEAILKAVQQAWSAGDLRALGHYVTPEMLSYFAEELSVNSSRGVENHVEELALVNGDVREAWDEGALQYATCLLRWRALDYTVRRDRQPGEPGWLVEGDPQHPSDAQELWTFARSPGGHWLLSAIQQV
jgi:predicted lipid-binding transport protein (Tim44 family)